jgi:hypothetical protein
LGSNPVFDLAGLGRRLGFSLKVIDPVPLKLDSAELAGNLKPQRLGEEAVKLFEKARPMIEPKAVYTSIRVSRIENDLVYLENEQTLRGAVLADMLTSGQEIVPYVVTVGPKLENQISQEKSLLQSYLMERIGDYALHKALAYLKSLAAERFADRRMPMSEFSPGTGTGELFSIEQQKPLFQILSGATASVGVHLTPSLMMIPRKSVSGVLAATLHEYVACAYCPRQCESRSTPFVGEYQRAK